MERARSVAFHPKTGVVWTDITITWSFFFVFVFLFLVLPRQSILYVGLADEEMPRLFDRGRLCTLLVAAPAMRLVLPPAPKEQAKKRRV